MTTHRPLVSVVMACYNGAPYVGEALQSIRDQTLADLELIFVDDCSTDGSADIARDYQRLDDRITIVRLDANRGPATARNVGIDRARGEWVGILDCDDVALRSRFEEQIDIAAQLQDVVAVASGCVEIDEHGSHGKKHVYPTGHVALSRHLQTMLPFPPHSSMLYSAHALRRVGAFNPRYSPSEDHDLWLRLLNVGKFSCIRRPLVLLRRHAGSISNAESGTLQMRKGITAIVCHFVRTFGYTDPASERDEQPWLELLTWVDTRLSEEGFFEMQQKWAKAKAEFQESRNRAGAACRLMSQVLASGHATEIVRQRLFGSSLPRRLAQEWVRDHARSSADPVGSTRSEM